MAENSWPFENQLTTEAQYLRLLGAISESGILTGLGLSASSGMGVSVAAGTAIVRGFFYENTSAKVLTIGAAPASGTTRRDAIVLRLDLAANKISVEVKAGAADSDGGTLPALTQTTATWEEVIGEVSVAAGTISITQAMITERQTLFGQRVIPYAGSAKRPTPAASAIAIGVDTTNRILELWAGGQWVGLTPALSWNAISGKPTTFTPAPHGHSWSEISGIPSEFNPTAHSHDDRYYLKGSTYTQAEINSLLGGKAGTSHNHDAANITSGTLPIARGGTGGTSASAARSALGIPGWSSSGSADPSTLVSRGSDGRFGIPDGTGSSNPVNKSQLDPVANLADAAWNGDLAAAVYSRTLSSSWRELFINSSGLLGWVASSRRFKQNIEDAPIDAAAALQLRPVTFRYRANARSDDPALQAQIETGLIAEEVDALGLRFLVDYDSEGRPEGVVYSRLALALLPIVKDQQSRIEKLEAAVAALSANTAGDQTAEG